MAKIFYGTRDTEYKGLRNSIELHFRKPYPFVLRRIIRRRIGAWALPEAFVKQMRNWRDKNRRINKNLTSRQQQTVACQLRRLVI